jgi:hypothetical protein
MRPLSRRSGVPEWLAVGVAVVYHPRASPDCGAVLCCFFTIELIFLFAWTSSMLA